MKKITYILSIILTSALMVAGVVLGYSYLAKNQPDEFEQNYEIVISNEVDVYYGEENKLLPYLVSNNGSVEQSRFDYVSSSDSIEISVDGDITILDIPENNVFVTISERNTGATKKVKLNIIQELQKVLGIIAPDGNLVTGTQELQFGNTYPITIITEPKNVSIEDYCTIKTIDANNVEHHVFDINYEGGKALLTVVGLGEGSFSMEIINKFGQNIYQTSFGFNISAEDKLLGDKILESSGKTLLSDSDMAEIKTVYVDETISSLETLKLLPNLETVIVDSNSLIQFDNLSDLYSYRVPDTLFYDYCADDVWAEFTHVLYPYEGDNEGTYIVYHSDKAEEIKYEKITDHYSLARYYFVGYKNTAWETSEGDRVIETDLADIENNGIHLYAVWEPIKYNISYHVRDFEGQITDSIDEWNYETNQELRTEKDFGIEITRTGYKFAGWTDNSSAATIEAPIKYRLGDKVTQLTEEEDDTIHLYDVWEPIKYKIIYKTIDGMVELDSIDVEYNKPYTLTQASKEGYEFIKWQLPDLTYLEAGPENIHNRILSSVDGAEIVLTPIFKEISYKIKFVLDGGISQDNTAIVENYEKTLSYNENFKLPLLLKNGYTTYIWRCEETGKTYSSQEWIVRVTSSATTVTLKAIWTAANYIVNYDGNGGLVEIRDENGELIETQPSYDDKRAWNDEKTLLMAVREGYTFKGWQDLDNNIYYAESDKANWPSNLISSTEENGAIFNLKADWSKNSYELKISRHEGTYLTVKVDGIVKAEGSHYIPYNSNIEVNYGTNDGYSNATCTFTGGRMPAETLTISTNATINKHKVKISIGSGSYMTVVIGGKEYKSSQTVENVAYGTSISVSSYGANSGYESPGCSCGYSTMPDKDIEISSWATKSPSCLAKGTPILSSNGKYVNIEDLSVGDTVVVFDQENACFVESKIAYTYYAYAVSPVVTLEFSNGAVLKIINTGHGLYDATLNQYVLVSDENAKDLIGHKFVYISEKFEFKEDVTLISCSTTYELVERYDIVTENQLTHIANGFLACSDTLVGICNIFEFDNNYQIDIGAMNADIERYGLYTYEEWSEYVTEEEFIKFRGRFFKIAIEKGLLTEEELFSLINDIRTFSTV